MFFVDRNKVVMIAATVDEETDQDAGVRTLHVEMIGHTLYLRKFLVFTCQQQINLQTVLKKAKKTDCQSMEYIQTIFFTLYRMQLC